MTELKSKKKAMKSLTQSKVVDIADFRSLQTGKEPQKVALVSADKNYAEELRGVLPEGLALLAFDSRFSFEQALKSNDFDALILDERNLHDDALSLCEKLKRQNHMDELIVLILSEDKSKEKVREGLEKGCDEWVTRVDDYTALARLLDHHLSL